MSNQNSKKISDFLKPLANLSTNIDSRVLKLAKNDFSESSIKESWQIAHQLNSSSQLLKKEARKVTNDLKDKVSTLENFENVRVDTMDAIKNNMMLMRQLMKDKYNYDSVPVIKERKKKTVDENVKLPKQIETCHVTETAPAEKLIDNKVQSFCAEPQSSRKPLAVVTCSNGNENAESQKFIAEKSYSGNDSVADGYSSSPERPEFLKKAWCEKSGGDSLESPDKPEELIKKTFALSSTNTTSSSSSSSSGPRLSWKTRVKISESHGGNISTPTELDFDLPRRESREAAAKAAVAAKIAEDDDEFYMSSNLRALKGWGEKATANARYSVGDDLSELTITNFKLSSLKQTNTPSRPSGCIKFTESQESNTTPVWSVGTSSSSHHVIKTPKLSGNTKNSFVTPHKQYIEIETPTPPDVSADPSQHNPFVTSHKDRNYKFDF